MRCLIRTFITAIKLNGMKERKFWIVEIVGVFEKVKNVFENNKIGKDVGAG